MLGQVPHTPQDVHFQVFGIPCRIHPYFWLAGIFFALPRGGQYPGNIVLALVLSRIACIFVSILIHELGHAALMRWAGFRPDVVLYAFGGYASYGAHRPVRTAVSVAISFAGPAAGFLFFVVVYLVGQRIFAAYQGQVPLVLKDAILQLEYINLFWGLVNLLPVFPLDGGQITRTLLQAGFGTAGVRISLVISIVASAGIAIAFYLLMGRQLFSFPVLLFGILCFESVQAYQAMGNDRRW